ncbi:MAG: exonuclease domain-containing protein [Oscillospiraceae bacterium]|nr:exonuclease domain-containing protein [Oscillospiraceae bacterium]
MNLIILDLEWNQPLSRDRTVTEPVVLNGEIIRIGAVKTNERMEPVDTFSICVRPKFYKKIHFAVGKVTGLESSSLTFGQPFPLAFERFMEFCGDDPQILVWGTEDERVLRANVAVHRIDCTLPRFTDIQVIFARRITMDNRQYGVSAAVEHYGLPLDLKAHDALNDAIYTYRIAKEMQLMKYIPDEYEKILAEIEEEKRLQRELRFYRTFPGIESVDEGMKNRKITLCRCPECKGRMRRTRFTFISEKKAIAYAECADDGKYLVTLKFSLCPNGKYDVTRSFIIPSAQQKDEYDLMIARAEERARNDAAAADDMLEEAPLE